MRILYEDKHGKYKDVPITDIQLTTLMANCAMAIVQYCIVRPKFMRYIRKHTANFEHLYENKHFVATVCSFPIAQQKEAEQVMAYLLLSDSVEYRNFLHANMNRIYLLVKNMIAYIAPLIDDFNLLQDRYYIVIVNTAFISHSMYFAVQKTAQNALFMYVDNLNVDTIATLLYHKYDKVVL